MHLGGGPPPHPSRSQLFVAQLRFLNPCRFDVGFLLVVETVEKQASQPRSLLRRQLVRGRWMPRVGDIWTTHSESKFGRGKGISHKLLASTRSGRFILAL